MNEINEFWRTYTNGEYEEYPIFAPIELKNYIERRNDTEMLDYFTSLNIYLDICNDIHNWDYPSEEDLADRTLKLKSLIKKSKSYSGSRLRSQYSLLFMRCNMLMDEWGTNKKYWESTARHLPDNVFRKMMENIYAGSLYREGNIEKATEIYVRHGDEESLRWAMNKYRGLSGIREIYSIDPNSPLLPYLIEEYTNNIQESLDHQNTEDNILYKGHQLSLSIECIPFHQFSQSVISSGESKSPCMWATAEAMLYYLTGNQSEAKTMSARSLTLSGNSRIKSNSRCVNILINSSDSLCDRTWLTEELDWLESQISKETPESYCFSNAYDRILMKSLRPLYSSHNKINLSLSVAGLYNEFLMSKNEYHYRNPNRDNTEGAPTWNDDYDNEYMNQYIYPLSASECLDYYNYLINPHSDILESYICSKVYKDSNFFNDIIGTKYISEGKFSDAIPYLQKVALSYLSKLNISDYMYKRDFKFEGWFSKQRSENDLEGIIEHKFTHNPKIDYCISMLELESQYHQNHKTSSIVEIAYQLACQYYQGSYVGDCWWLTSYSKRINTQKPRYEQELDFVNKAKAYLTFCANSDDETFKSKSIYALAYIPIDQWADYETDYNEEGEMVTIYTNTHPQSSQYNYLSLLDSYYDSHKEHLPEYISKCDVLKQFRKIKWYSE